jgi:hypothetical protein
MGASHPFIADDGYLGKHGQRGWRNRPVTSED